MVQGGTYHINSRRRLLTLCRTCLGKSFALAEFKVVLALLIRYFEFELQDGPQTPISEFRSLLPRPKVEGEEGSRLPLVIRRVD
jgi:hypothetical protein